MIFSDFEDFIIYLDKKNVLVSAVSIVIGTIISNIVNKIANEIISPFSKGDFETLKKISITEYFYLILNGILSSYILFKLLNIVKLIDKT